MSETCDVVIGGGTIADGAPATVLARDGIAVAVLERDAVPIDKVRGEFMAPWGVAELNSRAPPGTIGQTRLPTTPGC